MSQHDNSDTESVEAVIEGIDNRTRKKFFRRLIEGVLPDGYEVEVEILDLEQSVSEVEKGTKQYEILRTVAEMNRTGQDPTADDLVDVVGGNRSPMYGALTRLERGGLIHTYKPSPGARRLHRVTMEGHEELLRAEEEEDE